MADSIKGSYSSKTLTISGLSDNTKNVVGFFNSETTKLGADGVYAGYGSDTRVITAASWSIAGALGVLAAVMYAGGGTTISPSYMTTIQVNAFLAGILGGFSTFYGPVIGAVLIPVAASCVGFLANFGLYNISRWQMVIVYVLMLIVILIKPAGIFGKRTLKKV